MNTAPEPARVRLEMARPAPGDARAYLEALSKAVFRSGLSWQVVEAKWPAIRDAFHKFEPKAVARLAPAEINAIKHNPAVIRNRRKIEATVENAEVMLEVLAEHGDFAAYLASQRDPAAAARDLERRFEHVGVATARWFLYSVGEQAPPRSGSG